MYSGWIPKSTHRSQPHFQVIEDGEEAFFRIGSSLDYEEDDIVASLLESPEPEQSTPYVTLLEQARKRLDHMWCAADDVSVNRPQRSDWNTFKRQIRGGWSKQLVQMILLLAAMVSSQIGLSVAAWIRKYFVPVCIRYHELTVLGLLAKHARATESSQIRPILSLGRHLMGASSCKD